MFERIIAPRRRAPTISTPPLLASVAFHLLLAVAFTGAVARATHPADDPEPEHAARLLLPLLPSAAPPDVEELVWDGGTSAGTGAPAAADGEGRGSGRRRGSGRQGGRTVPGAEPGPPDGGSIQPVYAYDAVLDRPVSRHPLAGAPEYPPSLLAARIEGFVVAEFTVTERGTADSVSLEIAEVTHPGFAAALRAAMPRLRFVPAEHGGRPVRQRVQQRYIFRVEVTDTLRT
jgi:TonB family protein